MSVARETDLGLPIDLPYRGFLGRAYFLWFDMKGWCAKLDRSRLVQMRWHLTLLFQITVSRAHKDPDI
jgi:hypothetical protein